MIRVHRARTKLLCVGSVSPQRRHGGGSRGGIAVHQVRSVGRKTQVRQLEYGYSSLLWFLLTYTTSEEPPQVGNAGPLSSTIATLVGQLSGEKLICQEDFGRRLSEPAL